jgi:hypothetical protein
MGFLHSGDEAQDVTAQVGNVNVDPALLAQQQQFAQALTAQMNGQGPSVATQMLQNQAQQNAANASSMAQGQRGVNAGLAQRNAMNAAAQANQAAAQQGMVARTQEQLNATQALGGQLNTMQGQNMGAQQANQNAQLGKAQIQTGAAQQDANTNAGMVGGLINSAGSALAFLSDERQKTNIHDGTGEAYQFLDNLSAAKYQYKNPDAPGAAPGQQLGVMAQDIEKGAPQAVLNTTQGKMVDATKLAGPQMAALADLHERLKRLEGGGSVKMANGGFVDPGMTNPMSLGHAVIPYKAMDFGPMPKLGPSSATGQALAGGPMDNPGSIPGATPGMDEMLSGVGPAMLASKGAIVPGKAKVKGDSQKNDTVSAKLSPGEIVLPRTVVNSKNPGKAAMDFVNAILAKSSMSKGKAK